jgi:hypothetical protein
LPKTQSSSSNSSSTEQQAGSTAAQQQSPQANTVILSGQEYWDDSFVTNLDDGAKYSAEEVTQKFNVLNIANSSQEKEQGHFDEASEKSTGINMGQTKTAGTHGTHGTYQPLSVPDGGRLTFFRISAVGTTVDAEGKSYSVYYLDVRCHTASPSSWFVYRRYSQFRSLSDILRSEGYYVPVLP